MAAGGCSRGSVAPARAKESGQRPGAAVPRRQEIEATFRSPVVEQLGVESDEVTLEARFIQDLGCDSLDAVELVMATEVAFGIVISDDEAERLRTVGDAIAFVESKLGARRG